MNCAICLGEMRKTRHTCELSCGHCYHSGCFRKWEESGGETCPLCRDEIHKAKYKVTLVIKNVQRDREQTLDVTDPTAIENILSLFDIDVTTSLDNTDQLDSFLSELGLSLTNLDTSVLDAEG